MNKIYLTEEEKEEITDIQTQETEYIGQLGQIEYQIQSLQDNYGEGSINIETGEFIVTT